ncbi:MAG: HAMP domain-containing histidine kinase [Bacteroidales bacterium]|nr:HAMP domain-containing histidine kinase [Bacteroidales bacterium]
MKRWFRVVIISVFALAALSLVVIQFIQTRRTFSISDNMFNVSVNNAMDEVIKQLNGEVMQTPSHPASAFNYQELDSLIVEELLISGIDLHPDVGLYDGSQGSFLYSSNPKQEYRLEQSPYRYSFRPIGVVSANQYYIILAFPSSGLPFQVSPNIYIYMTLFLILVIATMFIISLRTIANQRKLDQMKSEFINNMTHEIKTPIATIGLACEMLSDDTVSQDADSRRNFIGIVADENQRMRVLVETILQSAKMSNKNFSIHISEVDINPIIDKVMQSFKLTLSNRGGQIEKHLEAVPSVVMVDELHLTNLIYNLVDNGIKYSTGAPHIIVSTAIENGRFLLRVQDHGIGISKADQKHVFEKFYRVSTGNVHNVKGFGIGLNYVAQVVRLHHGHITLDSEPGKGSTFTISLPV